MERKINNLHIIAKGVFVSLFLHLCTVGYLVITSFNTTLVLSTIIFLAIMAISSFYVGIISGSLAEVNGIIVALLTSVLLILYVAQYETLDWAVNRIIIASYVTIGFVFSLLSRVLGVRNKKKETPKNKRRTRQKKK